MHLMRAVESISCYPPERGKKKLLLFRAVIISPSEDAVRQKKLLEINFSQLFSPAELGEV